MGKGIFIYFASFFTVSRFASTFILFFFGLHVRYNNGVPGALQLHGLYVAGFI